MQKIVRAALAASLCLLGTAASAQSLVSNGSFESFSGGAVTDGGEVRVFNRANASLADWSVSGIVKLVNPTDDSAPGYLDGSQYVKILDGASLSQSLALSAGQYTLSFGYRAFGDSAVSLAGSVLDTFQADERGIASFTFTVTDAAAAASQLLAFSATTGRLQLDNVSVTAVPEPATYALMIAGLAMVSVAARRRRARDDA